MTESMFSFTTKFNGDLLTVRGNTIDEFTTHVAELVHRGQQIATDLVFVQGIGNAASLVAPEPQAQPPAPTTPPPAAPSAQGAWGSPPQPPQQAPQQTQQWQQQAPQQAGHMCDCGLPMRLRNSQFGSFYSCSKNMQDPSRCNKKINA